MSISGIYSEIYKKFVSGEAKLPSLPDVVIKIRNAVRDPNSSVITVARMLQADPALTAYLMKVVNSPFLMTRLPAKDIKTAVSRLGLRGTRDIVTSYALRSLFHTNSRVLRRRLIEIRRQSTKIAAISFVLARSFSDFTPDRVMLAGLLQDIGVFAVLTEIHNRPKLADNESVTWAAVSKLSPMVGVLMLENWKFDQEIVEVVRSREEWMRDPQPQADIADIVLIARLHSYIGTPLMNHCPRINEVPAFAKMPFVELTPRLSLKLVEVAHQDVSDLEQLLGA